MTIVRERRHQKALRLLLPSTCVTVPKTSSIVATSPISPGIESLRDSEKLELLGHGNGGNVYKVLHKKTMTHFALKVLRLNEDFATTQQEVEILKCVDSPYLVRCHAVFDSEEGLCFAMELMERGSLTDVLRICKVLSEDCIAKLAWSVLQGLRYLHRMHTVHGDIKPSNLLINRQGDVKIADFGVSSIEVGKYGYSCDSHTGTCAYMSPERIEPERWNGKSISCSDCCDGFAGDVWSLGVVVLECLVSHYPLIGFGEKPDWAALVCAICFEERLEMPKNASSEFMSFVGRCLEKDWRKRGTVEELLRHRLVRKSHGVVDFAP